MSTIREHVDIPLAAGFPFPTPAWEGASDQFYHRLYITRDDSWADWQTRPVVIFFHGSGVNVAPQGENSWFVQQVLAKGYVWIDSMALDAQGSCGTRPWKYPYGVTTNLNLNLSGVNLAWWVRSTMESTFVKGLSGRIVLLGHSMGGGAIMPYLAGRTGLRSSQIVGSIVNSHMTAANGTGGFLDGTRTLRYNNGLLSEINRKLLVVAGGADKYCPPSYMRRLQVSLKTSSPVYVMVGHRTGDHGWWTNAAQGQKMVQWCQQLIEGTTITDIDGNPALSGPVQPMPPLPPPPIDPVTSGVTSFNDRAGPVMPQAGDYAVADITGLTAALAGKASATHSHGISDVSGLAQALADKAPVNHSHTVAQVTGLQAALDAKAAEAHTHTVAQVTGLQAELDSKAPTTHSHSISQVTGLQAALDAKAPTEHSHGIAQVTGLQTALDGKAAVGTSYTKAQSDSALAGKQDKLDFVPGQTSTFLAKDGQWRTPEGGGGGTAGVASFNGRADDVLPEAGDYNVSQITGLQDALDAKAPSGHTHTVAQVTGLQAALDGKASGTHTHSVAQVTGLQAALDGKAGTSHAHSIAQVTGLQDELDALDAAVGTLGTSKADASSVYTKDAVDTALAAKAPTSHTHSIAQVTGLQGALDGKAPSTHTHTMTQVTGLSDALDAKADSVHGHSIEQVTGLQAALNGKAATTHTHTIAQVTGLQTALDAKAGTTHTHTTAQITGLDDALAGKLDKPVGGAATKWLTGTGEQSAKTFNATVKDALADAAVTVRWAAEEQNANALTYNQDYQVHTVLARLNYQVKIARNVANPVTTGNTAVGSMVFGIYKDPQAYRFGRSVTLSADFYITPADATGGTHAADKITVGTWKCLGYHPANGAPTLWIRTA